MNERWTEIVEFPGYSVSDMGSVRNDENGRLLKINYNQQGIAFVSLQRERRQFRRAVALLVARAFLDPPQPTTFDTPINLDGDRSNNELSNLMWRPRWYAVKYYQQFHQPRSGIIVPIEDVGTKEYFPNSWAAALTYGLLDKEIMFAVLNRTYVWPTYQQFRTVS